MCHTKFLYVLVFKVYLVILELVKWTSDEMTKDTVPSPSPSPPSGAISASSVKEEHMHDDKQKKKL